MRFAFELLGAGCVDGFRIDHVDGLFDPGDYLQRLQARARECGRTCTGERPLFVVVEKILGLDEHAAGLAGRTAPPATTSWSC